MTQSNRKDPNSEEATLPSLVGGCSMRSLRPTWFDCVTSFLLAFMILIGTLVVLLAVLWLMPGEEATANEEQIIDIVRWANNEGVSSTFIEPGFEQPNSLEATELSEPDFQQRLWAVTDAVSAVSTQLVDFHGSSPASVDGDARTAGDLGSTGVPRAQRWQLDFQAKDLHSYAQQLDFFAIELGVIGGSIQGVDYVSDLANQKPTHRRGDSQAEKRLYFLWTHPSPLAGFDRQLLQLGGANVSGRTMLKFLPKDLEQRLLRLELEFANAHDVHSVDQIAKTTFAFSANTSQPTITVTAQRYRSRNSH